MTVDSKSGGELSVPMDRPLINIEVSHSHDATHLKWVQNKAGLWSAVRILREGLSTKVRCVNGLKSNRGYIYKYGCFPKLVTLFVGPKGRFKDPLGRVWTAPSKHVMSIIQWS